MNKESDPVLWDGEETSKILSGSGYEINWQANGISIDSRTISEGDLFIALKGKSFDGHNFVIDALKRGAVAALVEVKPKGVAQNAPVLTVFNTMEALGRLADSARSRTTAKVITITGSVGKTGTKDLVAAGLASKGLTSRTEGNLNNHIGLPLSLARMPKDTKFGIFEIGMNAKGEITPLSRLARPHIAIITAIEAAHIGFFKNLGGIAEAKSEIFEGLEHGGIAIINQDNSYFEFLKRKAIDKGAIEVIGFGNDIHSEVRLESYEESEHHSLIGASVFGKPLKYRLQLLGRHWAVNSLIAFAVAHSLGIDSNSVLERLYSVKPSIGRGERFEIPIRSGHFLLIDESYNASPASVIAALSVLTKMAPENGGKKIAILGDMLELGRFSEELHTGLLQHIEKAELDRLLLIGKYMRLLSYSLVKAKITVDWYESVEDLIPVLPSLVCPGDVVMVKGSFGINLRSLVISLKEPRKGR